ncbi:MAG: hypothetical protein JO212_12800 [Acetobacteraceae bacterium]|nr:hypothetical protein [Acetobacteraceae bacterium]
MTSTPFPIGAYFGNPNASDPTAEAQWESVYNKFVQIMGGARPAFYNNYVDGSLDPSQWAANAAWSAASFAKTGDAFIGPGSGTTPVIGVSMAPANSDWTKNDTFFQGIISGQYDSVYKGIVDAWANAGYKTVQFRPGYEFNGNFMPWGIGNSAGNAQGGANAPNDFVSAFKHIADLIHQEGAADGITAQVVWNPNISSWSQPDGRSTADFYPGNQYVDIISADSYNGLAPFDDTDWATGGKTQDPNLATWAAKDANRAHYWSYPDANQYNPTGTGNAWSLLDTIALAKANGKPVSLSETGAGPNGAGTSDDPAFVQWEAGVLQNAQNSGVTVQNVDIWDSYQFVFTDGSKPNEAAAWGKYFGAQQPPVTAPSDATPVASASASDIASPVAPTTSPDPAMTSAPAATPTANASSDPAVTPAVGTTAPATSSDPATTTAPVPTTPASSDPTAGAAPVDTSTSATNPDPAAMSAPVDTSTPPATPAAASTSEDGADHKLVLNLSQDSWGGNAEFIAKLDGHRLSGPELVSALRQAGNAEAFSFTGNWGPGPHKLEIDLVGDSSGKAGYQDKNLYVNCVTYNGGVYSQDQATLHGNGSVIFNIGS